MPAALFPSFLLYALLCEITPGPVNLYALSCGLRQGRRSLGPLTLGLLAGFAAVLAVSAVLTLTIGELLRDYVWMLSWVGAAYILWLAWQTLRAGGETGEGAGGAPTFARGVLLQVSNVKTYLFCVTTLSAYVLPYTRDPRALLGWGLALPASGVACTLAWALAGSALGRFYARYRRQTDLVMAALLVLCALQLAAA